MSETDNPMATARRLSRPQLPRRFYELVTVEPKGAGFGVALDGRIAKTPGRNPLVVPSRRIAEALAGEWAGQGETIDPAIMPLTRLVNVAVDRVAGEMAVVRDDIVKYAQSDLVCYRADAPAGLAAAQDAAWSPLVVWARDALHAPLQVGSGIVHVPQVRAVTDAVAATVALLDPLHLAAAHSATTLAGSAVIALALMHGRLNAAAAWSAAHVDEDWQMSQWGTDEIALGARAARRHDFDAAALVLAAA